MRSEPYNFPMTHARGCASFWGWVAAGWLLALSLVSSIGVLTGPVAVVAIALIAWKSRPWPEPLGLLAGIGGLCLFVASLGTVEPLPWLAAGAVLVIVGVGGYAWSRSRPWALR